MAILPISFLLGAIVGNFDVDFIVELILPSSIRRATLRQMMFDATTFNDTSSFHFRLTLVIANKNSRLEAC